MRDERILITGATSGIGFELAYKFGSGGSNLVITGRESRKLKNMVRDLEYAYGIEVTAITQDLATPTGAEMLFRSIRRKNISISMLINNAGYGTYGEFRDTSWDNEKDCLHLNIFSLTRLTKLFLPEMLERDQGHIVNIASIASFEPGPYMAVYHASKAYVLSFSEALQSELRETSVAVTTICPGPTDTEFKHRARMEPARIWHDGYVMSPHEVARIAYEAIEKRKPLVVTGMPNKVLAFAMRFMPRFAIRNFAHRLNEPKGVQI